MEMREDIERRRHHHQPRSGAGTHWAPGHTAELHVGSVADCTEPECVTKRERNEA